MKGCHIGVTVGDGLSDKESCGERCEWREGRALWIWGRAYPAGGVSVETLRREHTWGAPGFFEDNTAHVAAVAGGWRAGWGWFRGSQVVQNLLRLVEDVGFLI